MHGLLQGHCAEVVNAVNAVYVHVCRLAVLPMRHGQLRQPVGRSEHVALRRLLTEGFNVVAVRASVLGCVGWCGHPSMWSAMPCSPACFFATNPSVVNNVPCPPEVSEIICVPCSDNPAQCAGHAPLTRGAPAEERTTARPARRRVTRLGLGGAASMATCAQERMPTGGAASLPISMPTQTVSCRTDCEGVRWKAPSSCRKHCCCQHQRALQRMHITTAPACWHTPALRPALPPLQPAPTLLPPGHPAQVPSASAAPIRATFVCPRAISGRAASHPGPTAASLVRPPPVLWGTRRGRETGRAAAS